MFLMEPCFGQEVISICAVIGSGPEAERTCLAAPCAFDTQHAAIEGNTKALVRVFPHHGPLSVSGTIRLPGYHCRAPCLPEGCMSIQCVTPLWKSIANRTTVPFEKAVHAGRYPPLVDDTPAIFLSRHNAAVRRYALKPHPTHLPHSACAAGCLRSGVLARPLPLIYLVYRTRGSKRAVPQDQKKHVMVTIWNFQKKTAQAK